MKTVGRFALGGFGVVIFANLAVFVIFGVAQGFGSSHFDYSWLIITLPVGTLLGAVAGALLAGVGLLLQRVLRRPEPATKRPAADETVWPPPPRNLPPE